MKEDEVVVDMACDTLDVRTKAVVAALRAALDKVYDEDGDQQVRRLANDYRAWSGEPDLSGGSVVKKSK